MRYTIAIFPQIKGITKINSIRKRYDPTYTQLKPHIALVYYFKKKPSSQKIKNILKKEKSFEILLDIIRASSKHNLIFLDVTKGKQHIVKLKEKLYNHFALQWTGDFTYKPHITIASCKKKGTTNSTQEC